MSCFVQVASFRGNERQWGYHLYLAIYIAGSLVLGQETSVDFFGFIEISLLFHQISHGVRGNASPVRLINVFPEIQAPLKVPIGLFVVIIICSEAPEVAESQG